MSEMAEMADQADDKTNSSLWREELTTGRIFSLTCNGIAIDGLSEGVTLERVEKVTDHPEIARVDLHYIHAPSQLRIVCHSRTYEPDGLLEKWVSVHNGGGEPVTVERLSSLRMTIPAAEWELFYFRSGWGAEFEPVREPLQGERLLETRKGRSSSDVHPWFTLFRRGGGLLTAAPVWSGNWMFRFEPLPGGGSEISGGLHEADFHKTLRPGESMEAVRVVLAFGDGDDLDETAVPFARVGRAHWYPSNALSKELPVEWNHWWSYEDKLINEDVFKANADEAARLGLDICTLDAGWFGPTDPQSNWYDVRGDWDLVNTTRFPGGIRALSDYVHGLGLKFGLWCEIEAVGKLARLAEVHPEYVARRDGESAGYLCFGNPEVQEWAFGMLDRLITEYQCDWIKLDFNLDPMSGCNRTDHGHGAGDGLFEHYNGYYRTLDRIREKHPEVLLENCSSGGLRIDLGILSHTHTTFLSDPDWPEHDLQLFWGATTMLAPNVCLHWSWCEWISEYAPQTFNPRDPALTQRQFDYYTRMSMLGGFGFSQKLPELPEWVKDRIGHHVRVYKNEVRRFVREGDLYRLSGQPVRGGKGELWPGFQYSLPATGEQLLFVFRLPGAAPEQTIRLKRLKEERRYTLIWLSEDRTEERTGRELMDEGLRFTQLHEEDSALIRIREEQGAEG